MTLIDVAIGDTTHDPDAWPRHQLDRERVAEFADLYEAGGPSALPPIEVVPNGENNWLIADGHHRAYAAWQAGLETLPAQVLPVPPGRSPLTVAYLRGLETAATSAKPLTRAERRAAVLRLLGATPRPSDRTIAQLTGVSHQTVGRLRTALDTPASLADEGDEATRERAASATAKQLTDRLVRSTVQLWQARGLTDLVAQRLPRTLADALVERFGEEDAYEWAVRLEDWTRDARERLERGT